MTKPYTYIIGWSSLNTYYYGVRVANEHDPDDDLWKHYFTSSNSVKEYCKQNGDPDIVQIDQIFDDKDSAVNYENNYILENKLYLDGNWLNKSAWPLIDNRGRLHSEDAKAKMSASKKGRPGKSPSDETREKLSMIAKNRVYTEETRMRMAAARRGKTVSNETKAKMAESQTGKPKSEETRKKISESLRRKKRGMV